MARFPKDFLWGASTSSYQTEGGNRASALWDWEVRKGWERSGEAARSWELFDRDLNCLKALGLNAYRFSLEWSRVEPEEGRFDSEALSRYAGWARSLKAAGIRPFVCLHHFSEPAWLLKAHPRGWLERGTAEKFLRYAARAAEVLAPLVEDWVVFNEPSVFLVGAYGFRYFPPGGRMLMNPAKEFNPVVVPNLARAHNEAYALLHRARPGVRVGVAQNIAALEPARPGDEEAVERWDWFMHRQFLDLIKGRFDFLGINYYTRIFVHRSPVPFAPMGVVPGYAELEQGLGRLLFRLVGGRRDGRPRTGMGWEVVPEGFGKILLRFAKEYGKPVYITENGMAEAPGITRSEYLRGHLTSLSEAMEAGADVRGYLHWSLMDNYEWGSYRPRFGLFTRDRRPAEGADYYARVAAAGEVPNG